MILLGVQARQQGFLSVLTDEWNVCACTEQHRLNKAYRLTLPHDACKKKKRKEKTPSNGLI